MYSGRKAAKKQAEALSIKYHTILTNKLEEEGKVLATTHVRNIQIREYYHTLSRRIKYIKGNFRKPGTTLVTKQQTNDSKLSITEKTH